MARDVLIQGFLFTRDEWNHLDDEVRTSFLETREEAMPIETLEQPLETAQAPPSC